MPLDYIIGKAVVKDCGYNPDVADTPEFTENLETTTPCNSFVTSVFDFDRFLYYIRYGMMLLTVIHFASRKKLLIPLQRAKSRRTLILKTATLIKKMYMNPMLMWIASDALLNVILIISDYRMQIIVSAV